MGDRYYDPVSARFLSPDPYGHGASMDLYSFAGGDPINFVDPTGRSATGIGSLTGGSTLAGTGHQSSSDSNKPKAYVMVGDNTHGSFAADVTSYGFNSANAAYAGGQLTLAGYDVTIDYSGTSESLQSHLGDPNTKAFVYYGHGGFDGSGQNPVIETQDGVTYSPAQLGDVAAADSYDHVAIHGCYSCVEGEGGEGFKETLNAEQFHGYDRPATLTDDFIPNTVTGSHLTRDQDTVNKGDVDWDVERRPKPSKDKTTETKSDKMDPVSGKNPKDC